MDRRRREKHEGPRARAPKTAGEETRGKGCVVPWSRMLGEQGEAGRVEG